LRNGKSRWILIAARPHRMRVQSLAAYTRVSILLIGCFIVSPLAVRLEARGDSTLDERHSSDLDPRSLRNGRLSDPWGAVVRGASSVTKGPCERPCPVTECLSRRVYSCQVRVDETVVTEGDWVRTVTEVVDG